MSSKLTTRAWIESDMPTLAEFHRQMNPGYRLPETFGPLFAVRRVVVDESGQILGFGVVKLVGEGFFFVNPVISQFQRAKCIKILNEECAKDASELGLEDVSCWVPTRMLKCFGKTLAKLGWRKSPWRTFSRVLG